MGKTLAIALLFLAATPSHAKQAPSLTDSELSLGDIALGDTQRSVVAKLGDPSRTTDTGEGIRLDYPGLTIWLGQEHRVGEILSTSSAACSPSGVCPGQALAVVKGMLGTPLVAPREDGSFLEYPSSQSACWLQLTVLKGIVMSVRAECQP
jgi:hypothetical protein